MEFSLFDLGGGEEQLDGSLVGTQNSNRKLRKSTNK
jgi:hypothetical protein